MELVSRVDTHDCSMQLEFSGLCIHNITTGMDEGKLKQKDRSYNNGVAYESDLKGRRKINNGGFNILSTSTDARSLRF